VGRLLAQTPGWQPDTPYIVVNPNASDLLLERRWPTESVIRTIGQLVESGKQIALMGARMKASSLQSLFEGLTPDVQFRVVNTAGRLTLGELLALLEGCLHSDERYGSNAYGDRAGAANCLPLWTSEPRALWAGVALCRDFLCTRFLAAHACTRLTSPRAMENNICMQRIEPEAVTEAVLRLAGAGFQAQFLQLVSGYIACINRRGGRMGGLWVWWSGHR